IVHGHHAHVPQGFEQYGRSWIVYGAGNTLVNPAKWPEGGMTLKSWRYLFDLDNLETPPQLTQWQVSSSSPRHVAMTRKRIDHENLEACNAPLNNPILLEGLWQENSMYLWKTFYASGLKQQVSVHFKPLDTIRQLRRMVRSLLSKRLDSESVR